jgi:serine/threonine protein kinase
MTLGAGEIFAGYTIVRQIGSGGMGEVYLARSSHSRSGAPNRRAYQFHTKLPFRSALHVAIPSVYSTRARAPGSAHAVPCSTAGRDR